MSMNLSCKVIHYVIVAIPLCGKNYKIGGKKTETKYRWETIDVIPLLKLVGVNHRQPIVQMSERTAHLIE